MRELWIYRGGVLSKEWGSMNLPVVFAFASAGVAILLSLAAAFGKSQALPKWVLALSMLALACEQLLSGVVQISDSPSDIASIQHRRFLATAVLPGLWLVFAITYSRANALAAVRRRLTLILPAFVVPLGLAYFASGSLMVVTPRFDGSAEWVTRLGWSGFVVHFLFLVSLIGALVGLERTFRASVGTMRWKIKFMLYGLGTLLAARFFTSSQVLLAQEIDPALDTVNAVALIVACLLIARAMLRPGLFEIDLYPSQSVISGSLTITLAGTYLIVVGVLSKIVSMYGGDQAFAIKTLLVLVALVLLALLIQSDRFRQLTRRFVSRNFQRPLYDYRTLWLKVTEATSHSVRREDICQTTTRMLANLLDTKLTNIWLLDTTEGRFSLVASSDQSGLSGTGEKVLEIEDMGIASQLHSRTEPFDLDAIEEDWANAIKGCNVSSFDDGGNRILVPLVGHGVVVGFMILGDRTNTLSFTQQEFDTLKCIADHISASLLSAELTRKLEQSKEIEAFQTMATFFVHDLKNAVSTLNLMLKNMPQHWDNPEFREDALKGISGTSNRITQLITRLGSVRRESQVSLRPCDLGEVATRSIGQWHRGERIEFSSSIQGTFAVMADPEKLESVILNLLINASEALEQRGRIEMAVFERDGWACLKVADNGPGMSPDFLKNSLFRPFKTTKKSGLGIGMFQSKSVMEAHGGGIQVVSEVGNGSAFTLRLPLSRDRATESDRS